MPKRVIMRIEVLPAARAGFFKAVDRNGSTNVVVVSRLIEWFITQPEMLQAHILGLLPVDEQRDVTWEVMRELKGKWRAK